MKIVIIYRSESAYDFAYRIFKWLEECHEFSVFLAPERKERGGDWKETVGNEIIKCDFVLLVLTKESLSPEKINNPDDNLRWEILFAKNEKYNQNKTSFVTIFKQGYVLPSRIGFPEDLAFLLTLDGCEIFNDHFDASMEKLVTNFLGLKEFSRKKSLSKDKEINWTKCRTIAQDISKTTIEQKHDKRVHDLLIKRKSIRDEIEKFLFSKYPIFVLTGESGTGKTSFLIKLEEEFQTEKFKEYIFFFLDAASIKLEVSIEEILTREFSDRFKGDIEYINNIIPEFKRLVKQGKSNRKVLICIDGINNNASPEIIKNNIELLANSYASWMKIIVSSTSDLWGLLMKKHWEKDDNYYRSDSVEKGVIKPIELGSFTEEEFKAAYQNYQARYQFQTNYTEIKEPLKTVLRDPFSLALTAKACNGRKIPPDTTLHSVIPRYEDSLSRDEILKSAFQFLKLEIVPLLFSDGQSQDRFTDRELINHKLTKANYLPHLNRLQNCGVLRSQKINSDKEDVLEYYFSSDRLFDYYSGEFLFSRFELNSQNNQGISYLKDLFNQVHSHHFFLGPLKNLIINILEMDEDAASILRQTANDNNQLTQDLLSDILIDYHLFDPEIITRLLTSWKPVMIRQFRFPLNQLWFLVAIEIAAEVNASEILLLALHSDLQIIRDRAITATYRVWRNNRLITDSVIIPLIKEITLISRITKPSIYKSALDLTLLVFFNHSNDESRLKVIRSWKQVFQRLGLVKKFERKSDIISLKKNVIWFIISALLSTIKKIPGRYSLISMGEIKAYYKLPSSIKNLTLELVNILENGDRNDQLEIILNKLFDSEVNKKPLNNMLLKLIIDFTLVSEGHEIELNDNQQRLEKVLRITRTFAEKELSKDGPKRCMWDKTWVYCALAWLQKSVDPYLFEIYESYSWNCYTKVENWEGSVREYAYLGYSDFARIYYKYHDSTEVKPIKEMLEWAIFERRDYQKAVDILEELVYLAASDKYWKISIFVIDDNLEQILQLCQNSSKVNLRNQKLLDEMKEKIIKILAIINAREANAVRVFLRDKNLDEFYNQVKMTKITEGVASVSLKGGLGTWGQFELEQGFSSNGKEFLVWIARSACKANNLKDFLIKLASKVISIIVSENEFSNIDESGLDTNGS